MTPKATVADNGKVNDSLHIFQGITLMHTNQLGMILQNRMKHSSLMHSTLMAYVKRCPPLYDDYHLFHGIHCGSKGNNTR